MREKDLSTREGAGRGRGRVQVVHPTDPAIVGAAGVVTDSGQVLPIDAEMVAHMKPPSVVPLT
jgi:hypothetical protein